MTDHSETLVRLTDHGRWHAVPYGDSYNETSTLCGLSFCPNQVERRGFTIDGILWTTGMCRKCDKAVVK